MIDILSHPESIIGIDGFAGGVGVVAPHYFRSIRYVCIFSYYSVNSAIFSYHSVTSATVVYQVAAFLV